MGGNAKVSDGVGRGSDGDEGGPTVGTGRPKSSDTLRFSGGHRSRTEGRTNRLGS